MHKTTTENDVQEISKSQRKREAHALLDLARTLISMPQAQLDGLPLGADLREEVAFARGISSHGARKRQLMTVAKMLRNRDNEELLEAVNNIDQKHRQQNARFHHVESWRDFLISDDQAVSELLEKYPGFNVQTMRQLIRNARKETKLSKPPTAARKLFKLLREADAENPLPTLPDS